MARKWFKSSEIYEFSDFRLDPAIPALRHSGATVSLTPKVLQTLLILIENRESVVSKEDFHQKLWPGIFIDENAIPQNIYLLRKALKERDPDHEYIENVPRRGYRFLGTVRILRGLRRLPILAAALIFCGLTAGLVWQSRAGVDRGTGNQEAYDLYLLGRTLWLKRDPARMDQAFQYLRQAVDKDPHFALAWAALADFHAFEQSPAIEARRAAEWALTLNPSLAEPYTTFGFIAMVHDWDWPTAERHFRRSIELNPRYTTGRQWYGLYLTLSGRFAEAEVQLQQGLRIEPVSVNLLHQRCVMLYHSRQYTAAKRECSKVLEIDPVFRFARESMMKIHARLGDYQWMLEHLGGEGAGADYKARTDGPVHKAYNEAGNAGYWRGVLERSRNNGTNFLGLSAIYMELGDVENAIQTLARAVDTHEFRSIYACSDPVYDPIRGDPRFHAVLQKVCGSQTR